MSKKYLRLENAAAQFDLDVRWLRQQCLRKKIRASKVGRKWHIPVEELDTLFRRGANRKEA